MSCNNKYVKPYHFKHKETLTFVRLSNFEERKEDYFAWKYLQIESFVTLANENICRFV